VTTSVSTTPLLSVTFVVTGTPAPQGSKTRTRWGSMREDNPNTMPWRQEVAARAKEAMGNALPMLGAVRLTVQFCFARPKGHYRTGRHAGDLRPNAPVLVTSKPDLSKLLRSTEDAMTGIVYRDDAQIAVVQAEKAYVMFDPSAQITVELLAGTGGDGGVPPRRPVP
jgi:Holliday junction resolvase RusA-like endonuclease